MAELTPFQTVGPFLSIGLRAGVTSPAVATGEDVVIRGRLIDGAGAGIPDGVLEWWHPSLAGIQRSLTAEDGNFRVEILKPPAVTGPDGRVHAPHLAVIVLGRGIQTHYRTRLYFADDQHTAEDPVLSVVPVPRRATLLAHRTGANEYRFDVIVQGDNETVFFDI